MTHEELLEQIQTFGSDESYGALQLALRAVVELHKPSGGGSNFCYACSFELEIPYPCPTIQAIEKELG